MQHIEHKKQFIESVKNLEKLLYDKLSYFQSIEDKKNKFAKRLEIEINEIGSAIDSIKTYDFIINQDVENLVYSSDKQAILKSKTEDYEEIIDDMLPIYQAEMYDRNAYAEFSRIQDKMNYTGMSMEEVFLRETLEKAGKYRSEERINNYLKNYYGLETAASRSEDIF